MICTNCRSNMGKIRPIDKLRSRPKSDVYIKVCIVCGHTNIKAYPRKEVMRA